MSFSNFEVPYPPDQAYSKRVAYFSMEFAIDQSLKIFSGGLGFLAGSHMRSAKKKKQNLPCGKGEKKKKKKKNQNAKMLLSLFLDFSKLYK